MSLFKYGDLEAEIDFTDVDFLERLEEAKALMMEEAKATPKTGKSTDIIRAQCRCYFNFFDRIIGEGAHDAMFCGKTSLNACLDAADALLEFENREATSMSERYSQYTVQNHGSREQKRNQNKQQRKRKNQNRNFNVSYR